MCATDDHELHAVSENPFNQREFTSPLEQDIVAADTSRNVRRHLVSGHSGIFSNAAVFSGTTELRLGIANTIHGCDTAGINCVPIRRVFDRFRNMRTPYIEANSMTHPDIEVELRPGTANTIRGRGTSDINCVPVRRVFDWFRNMRAPYIEADCMTQPAANADSVCQSPVLTVNQAYLCLDIKDCNITPAIKDFPPNALEDIRDKHVFMEYSRGCAQYVHSEVAMNQPSNANARKRTFIW
ncbi:hypothetical protein Tco_1196987 [Tanacetum coccineum]